MDNQFDNLLCKHKELCAEVGIILKQIASEIIRDFVEECREMGKYESDVRRRDQLRSIIQFWAPILLLKTDKYPDTDLA